MRRCPYLQKDIDKIKEVQCLAMKTIPELTTVSYERRPERTGLIFLEMHRLRVDLLEVFISIVKGMENVDHAIFFSVGQKIVEQQVSR